MPRSFLVKKYLKQKYDADFKLQQALNNSGGTEGSIITLRPEETNKEQESGFLNPSGKAATPYTPTSHSRSNTPYSPGSQSHHIRAGVQPLAVRLSNGYIYDVTHPEPGRVGGDTGGDAKIPKPEDQSAAGGSSQHRRSSVIVTNTNYQGNRNNNNNNNNNHNSNKNSSSNGSRDSISARNVTVSDAVNGHYSNDASVLFSPSYRHTSPYVSAYSHFSYADRDSPSLLAYSPPPAHTVTPTPISSALMTSPTPAHTSPMAAHQNHHQPILTATSTAAALTYHAQSPPPSHSPQPKHRGEVLPADHPIHHPLIQHLINQRLHVPAVDEEVSYEHTYNDDNHSDRIRTHREESVHDRRASASLEHQRMEEEEMEEEEKEKEEQQLKQQSEQISLGFHQSTMDNSTANVITLSESDMDVKPASVSHSFSTFKYSTHLPLSPNPSLPSSPTALPSSSSMLHPPSSPSSINSPPPHSPSLPSNSPNISLLAPQEMEMNAYTYDAFVISDGRSRKRALDGQASKTMGRVRYTCNECGKDYATSSNLSRHRQTHRALDSKSAKTCPHCDKVYVSMPALSMHILTHDLKHACNICGKTFSRPWLLQGHLRSHTGEKPFGCAHCGKAFADRSNLRAHMQTHSAFKHFACDKCNKTFALKSYLNKHLESACTKDDQE